MVSVLRKTVETNLQKSTLETVFLLRMDRVAGLIFVLVLHVAVLFGLWSNRLIPSPLDAATVFVNFIAPPALQKAEEPRLPVTPKPQPKTVEKTQPRQLVVERPTNAPGDHVAPAALSQSPEPAIQAPSMILPSGPVALSTELSVACTERLAPVYPSQSRRLNETGVVILRVELNETGHVALATIKSSSGYSRLDEAALAAVRTWRCAPAIRNGHSVSSVALQPFNFILQGN